MNARRMKNKSLDLLRSTVWDEIKGMMNSFKSCIYMLRHYDFKRPCKEYNGRMLIFNVDRFFYSGGMADRFKGAVTAYAFCKQRGIDFRIRYVFPFELSDFLLPAEYDWRLREGEYLRNVRTSRLMYSRAERGRRLMRQNPVKRQLHYYGNYDNLDFFNAKGGTDYEWGVLFRELFRPGPELEKALQKKHSEIGEPYIAAVYRFQNLLGDFHEYAFTSIDDKDRCEELISICIDGLLELQKANPGVPVLVTSDSSTFISRISGFSGIHTVGGCRVHIGCDASDSGVYLNSFIDFYMLAESTKVYCLGTSGMYPSQFPMYAAKVYGIPFERVLLK